MGVGMSDGESRTGQCVGIYESLSHMLTLVLFHLYFSTLQLLMYLKLAVQARNRLVQHNIRIVDHWARRLIQHSNAGKDVSYYELVAEGLIGLTKAAECYKPGRVRFYTHAEIYIRSELYKGLTKLRAGSHASHKVIMANSKLQKAQNYLPYTLKRKPSDKELASFLKMKEGE